MLGGLSDRKIMRTPRGYRLPSERVAHLRRGEHPVTRCCGGLAKLVVAPRPQRTVSFEGNPMGAAAGDRGPVGVAAQAHRRRAR